MFQPQFDELYRLVTRCSFSEKHIDVRCLLVFQPQFDELYRRVQTVAIEAELSQMEKCSLNEGLVLIRSFCLSLQWKLKKALRETQNLRAGCSKAAQLLDVAKRPIP